MIEVYLNDMRFPVVPPSIGKNVNADISTSNIVKKGKVNIFNGKEPDSISLAHFFPSQDATYSFIDVKGQDPYYYVNKIEKWCKTGERLRYIVTGTPINIQVKINHFEYKENDASGDVYYILELKEDEDININEWTPKRKNENKSRGETKYRTLKGVHKVKKGEYIQSIAKKYYGDGSLYPLIIHYGDNAAKYPELEKSNKLQEGMELIIP